VRDTVDRTASPEDRIRRALTERCRIAGGVRAGFSLRRTALEALAAASGGSEEVAAAIDGLLASDRLAANEDGSRVYLTETGVTWLDERPTAPDSSSS
jgi:hypothetical protein